MLAALGWLGAVLLAACGLPLLVNSRVGDRAFLWLWWAGEFALGVFVALDAPRAPLLANYGLNFLLVSLVLWRRRKAP